MTVKRNHLGEFFIVMVLDQSPQSIGKTHDGASVGIDFGLKKYMTLSDGRTVDNPQFLKSGLRQLRRKSRNLSKCLKGSHNRERKRLELDRHHEKVVNQRNEFQWQLAHQLCRQYDRIFIEDLQLTDMSALWVVNTYTFNAFTAKTRSTQNLEISSQYPSIANRKIPHQK